MAHQDYEQIYRNYIDAVNKQHFEKMDEFIADTAVFSGTPMSPKTVGEHLASFTVKCENGLHFELIDFVIDEAKAKLAARLAVSGKPTEEFFGFQPTGREMKFKEAAFYHFENGKIVKCDTMVDRRDIEESLNGKG